MANEDADSIPLDLQFQHLRNDLLRLKAFIEAIDHAHEMTHRQKQGVHRVSDCLSKLKAIEKDVSEEEETQDAT